MGMGLRAFIAALAFSSSSWMLWHNVNITAVAFVIGEAAEIILEWFFTTPKE